jgi:uncharacterized protein (TIGR02147 family)
MKSVYEYNDPNLFFKERWEHLKLKRPELSVRSLANYLELKAHGPLHQMLQGKRKIGQSYIHKIADYLHLTEREKLYFDLLVKFSRSKSVSESDFYLETLKEIKPKNLPSMEIVDNFEIQKEPLHYFIMEMAEFGKLTNDHMIIRKRLLVNYTSFEVKAAIGLLLANGYLVEDEKGMLNKTQKHLFSLQDIKNIALVKYHQKLLVLSHSAIENQDVLEREYNGTAFNISKKRLPQIKEEMREFMMQMIAKYEEPKGSGDSTYQLNLQFFKVAEK